MLPEATAARVGPVLTDNGVDVAYFISPLPPGLLTVSRGGLGLLFGSTVAPSDRYDRCQRLRFSLMGVLPTGQTEMISLNDARFSLAAAVVSAGEVVLSRDEASRSRFETMVLSASLDFEETIRRYESTSPGV